MRHGAATLLVETTSAPDRAAHPVPGHGCAAIPNRLSVKRRTLMAPSASWHLPEGPGLYKTELVQRRPQRRRRLYDQHIRVEPREEFSWTSGMSS
jgi:hypothetical protein